MKNDLLRLNFLLRPTSSGLLTDVNKQVLQAINIKCSKRLNHEPRAWASKEMTQFTLNHSWDWPINSSVCCPIVMPYETQMYICNIPPIQLLQGRRRRRSPPYGRRPPSTLHRIRWRSHRRLGRRAEGGWMDGPSPHSWHSPP